MKKKSLIFALSALLALSGGGLALSSHLSTDIAFQEVDAIAYPYSYALIDSEGNVLGDVKDDGTADSMSFSITLSLNQVVQIQVTNSYGSKSTIAYAECISGSLSAYFSENSYGAYIALQEGTYTFTFVTGWGATDDKHNGLTISVPDVNLITVSYSRIIVHDSTSDGKDHLPSSSKAVAHNEGATLPTYNDFTPEAVYGYDFGGFYRDSALTDQISLTEEVAQDVEGIYAKFTPSWNSTNYDVDYSPAMGTSFLPSYKIAYRAYKDEDNFIPSPGIIVDREINGTFTMALPSDAATIYVVSLDENNEIVGQMSMDASSQTSGVISLSFKDGGTLTSGIYKIDAFIEDDGFGAILTALAFVAGGCGTSMNNSAPTETMKTWWSTIENATSEFKDELATMPALVDDNGVHVDGIAGLLSIYDFCVVKYGSALGDPLNRNPNVASISSSLLPFSSNEEASSNIAIVGIISLSAIAGLAYFLIKKKSSKKEEN